MLRDLDNPDMDRLRQAIRQRYLDGEPGSPQEDHRIQGMAARAAGGPFPYFVAKAIQIVHDELKKEKLIRWDAQNRRFMVRADWEGKS